jgi:hypothetical protein
MSTGENVCLAKLLVEHGATQAAGVVQSALDLAMKLDSREQDSMTTRELTVAVYTLTGKTPDYWDFYQKKPVPLVPLSYEEDKMRDLLRPDLIPIRGLTAAFSTLKLHN